MTDLPSRMRFVKEHNRKDFTRQILNFFCIMVDGYQCLLIASLRSKRSCSTEENWPRESWGKRQGTLARRPPIFEKPVRPRTGASDWCGTVTMIDR